MAKLVSNEKGFLVIKMTYREICAIKDGSYGICDLCGSQNDYGYYIPVIDSYYCENCYKLWLMSAVNYKVDSKLEKERFDKVYNKFKQLDCWEQ